jgi:dipeptidyl-peptidase-4
MKFISKRLKILFYIIFLHIIPLSVSSQIGPGLQWADNGYQYFKVEKGNILLLDVRDASKKEIVVSNTALVPSGKSQSIDVRRFEFSDDKQKILIHTNTRKVWRYDTRGDYWVFDLNSKLLRQVGVDRPEASLMFAKFSPDGQKVAYVSNQNIYTENLADGTVKQLTSDGTNRLINGTFDWVYEEEFDCRDGFRWSPDSKSIAYWQIDASKIKNYLMINNTDSLYPFTIPVEYPVVGEDPSRCRIGVVPADGGSTKWMAVPGDDVQNYIPRMEWAANSAQLIIQQLNRRQNQSRIMLCDAVSGESKPIYTETDDAWIDAKPEAVGWNWLNKGKEFIWLSEKGGWRQIYIIDRIGKERLITPGNYDVISIELVDEKAGLVYFMASPKNATQSYLYKVGLKGNGKAVKVTPNELAGRHQYDISPNGKLAIHSFSNSSTFPVSDVVALADHKRISGGENGKQNQLKNKPEFFQVTTVDGITMDGWMVKPTNFDSTKRYPIVFYVYGEPAGQTVKDEYGTGFNRLYEGSMADDGYIYASVEGRGAPAPKGREWRKSIYRNIGIINIRDQAMAAQELLKRPYIDSERVAVWGWSGGGSSTLNLLFQYPKIYTTGISIAAVDNQLNYDNIYQERYMGLLPEDKDYFVKGSPLYHAKNLEGNLLLIHGTGDDNVHYNNAEQMINELVKHNKVFQLMAYPNRSHSISEGEGTSAHLAKTFTKFLKDHCPPGGR